MTPGNGCLDEMPIIKYQMPKIKDIKFSVNQIICIARFCYFRAIAVGATRKTEIGCVKFLRYATMICIKCKNIYSMVFKIINKFNFDLLL